MGQRQDRFLQVRRTTRTGLRRMLSPTGLRAGAVELAWVTTHLVMYPLGIAEEKAREEAERFSLHGLPPVQRGLVIGDVEAAGTPILLVHGVTDNRSIFTVLRRGLRRKGFGRVTSVNYSQLSEDVRTVALRLSEVVEAICADTGYERVHVIGHSMGGLVARYYVQRLGGDQRVHTVVTLGTPHAGTFPARLVPHPVARQMRPHSDVLAELAEPAPGCRTRFVSFWSDFDQMIIPKRSARLEHPDLMARNVFVRGVGHMSLPIDGRVVHEICATLAHLDHDGTTLTAGVTSITSESTARTSRPRAVTQSHQQLRRASR
ncbi:MAG: alpha/beta fold hydrolase [Actinomycetia bacterium]|nr:alpha/beta fold hydrolase [Actinomycetes bacterium]